MTLFYALFTADIAGGCYSGGRTSLQGMDRVTCRTNSVSRIGNAQRFGFANDADARYHEVSLLGQDELFRIPQDLKDIGIDFHLDSLLRF